jgi:hypothetical protein
MKKKLHYPVLSRFDLVFFRLGGPGLGNLLFPVCRAFLAWKKDGGVFIYPTWRQLKIGPYLRGEVDKRSYGNLFRKRTFLDWLNLIKAKVSSLFLLNSVVPFEVIKYTGLGNYFHDFSDSRYEILSFINQIMRGEASDSRSDICIHVRTGDFIKTPDFDQGGHSIQSERSWYITATRFAISNWDLENPKITIFSDGCVNDIKSQLENYGVVRVDQSENALEALLHMSRCEILIGSRSTFSGWASYLSDAITIWPKGFHFQRFSPERVGKDFSI